MAEGAGGGDGGWVGEGEGLGGGADGGGEEVRAQFAGDGPVGEAFAPDERGGSDDAACGERGELGIGDGDALLAFGKVVPVHLGWRKGRR